MGQREQPGSWARDRGVYQLTSTVSPLGRVPERPAGSLRGVRFCALSDAPQAWRRRASTLPSGAELSPLGGGIKTVAGSQGLACSWDHPGLCPSNLNFRSISLTSDDSILGHWLLPGVERATRSFGGFQRGELRCRVGGVSPHRAPAPSSGVAGRATEWAATVRGQVAVDKLCSS